MYTPALLDRKQEKPKSELIEEKEDLEFQIFRMQENMKQIAQKYTVLGIDQTKAGKWVIIYYESDGPVFKLMAHDCESPFNGKWDFSIHTQYQSDFHLHIDDIRGEENKGFGSVCMKFLKEYAVRHNIHTLSGNLSHRDWDHINRLVYFYRKHHFSVAVNEAARKGSIHWHP